MTDLGLGDVCLSSVHFLGAGPSLGTVEFGVGMTQGVAKVQGEKFVNLGAFQLILGDIMGGQVVRWGLLQFASVNASFAS